MLCRVADDVFWMARYVERALAVARLIDVTWHLELDAGDPDQEDAELWAPLLGAAPGEARAELIAGSAAAVRQHLALAETNPTSLVSCVRRARAAARGVREAISSEMWEQLNTLYLSLVTPRAGAEEEQVAFFKRMREGLQFFQGLADSTLARDETWHFYTLGTLLERASNVARVLLLQAHLLGAQDGAGEDAAVRALAVLRSCGSAEAYARYYSMRADPGRVIEFLLLNPIFPQSVRFSLTVAMCALHEIDEPLQHGASSANEAVRALGQLHSRLEHTAVDEIMEEGLERYLQDVQRRIVVVGDLVTRIYLRHEPQPGPVAVARAAMIMAAQQQQ